MPCLDITPCCWSSILPYDVLILRKAHNVELVQLILLMYQTTKQHFTLFINS